MEAMPEMQSVLEQMKIEEAAGLERVSSDLEPDVRHMARTALTIGLEWSKLSTEVTQLEIDRFLETASSGNLNDTLESLEHTLCITEHGWDGMQVVMNFFPDAVLLAYVERLNY